MDQVLKNKFKSTYKQLNLEQKKAVDAIDGPVMVIAGPGTGKTHLLTMRIANILDETDTPPEAILALTFTESAVSSMRKSLTEIIGTPAYHVKITTFHSFANDIIKNYPDDFPDIIGSTNITDVDQVKIIHQIIDNTDFKKIKPFGNWYFYLPSIIKAISELKRQGILPEEFLKIIQKEEKAFLAIKDLYHESGAHKGKMKGKYIDIQKNIDRNKELAIVYRDYQSILRKSRFYDYSDMIMQVMLVLESNNDLLLTLQEQYLYILVDEHQDTNSAQNRILELLANYHKNPNLFIVGDEKQAIFRFQGASLENFLYFKNLYKNVKLIALKHNYRSTQAILNAAHDLNSNTNKLIAKAGHPELPIKFYTFSTPEAEQYFLAKNIKELIEKGKSASQIAVLYRENREVIPIARIFEKVGIPFVIESDQDVLDDEDIKKLLIILKAVQKFGSDPELIELLYVDIFDIPPLDVYKLANLYKKRINPYDAIRSPEIMKEAGIETIEKLQDLSNKLSIWKNGAHNKNAIQAFEDIVRDSGFLMYILANPSAAEKIVKVHALFDQIKSLIKNHKNYTLENFFEYLDVLQEHNVSIRTMGLGQIPGRVRLMTAHKSKGLEFEYVYIINAVNGHWGSRRHHEPIKLPRQIYSLLNKINEQLASTSDEDERNLFYVALTRAKKEVLVTYSQRDQDNRDQLPSQFVQEIKTKYIERIDMTQQGIEFDKHKDIEFAPVLSVASTVKEKEFLNQLFLEHGLSVTALNNYLKCPWKYFYTSLIRIPESPNKHLIFGSAIHSALKSYFDRFMGGKDLKKEYLIQRFAESLAQKPIQEQEYREALNKGKIALSGYYDNYHNSWRNNILTEFNINGIQIDKDITINGKIDKMEFLSPSNHVNVVDYKTGKPKSRNDIEGYTKNSKGDYKRQLVFYNLLLNNYQNSKFKMISGEIDFVEPDDKGKYRKELFEIEPKEITELEKQIKVVAKEILHLSFWDKKCDDPDCYYCKLRRMMK